MKHNTRFFVVLILSIIITLLISNKNEWATPTWVFGIIVGFIASVLTLVTCYGERFDNVIIFIKITVTTCLLSWFLFQIELHTMYWIALEIVSLIIIIISIPTKCTYTHNKFMCDDFS